MSCFRLIQAERANFPISLMCRLLRVARSGFYSWQARRESLRSREDKQVLIEIKAAHTRSRGTYGAPRVHRELMASGNQLGLRRVARLMRENQIAGVARRRFKVTTDSKHSDPVAENILDRAFRPSAPGKAWVADITYIRTWEGWAYLAVVIDLFSRKVVGWSLATHMRTELASDALEMALGRAVTREDLLHHSDRGSVYTSHDYQKMLHRVGITASMSRKGNCWDNAVAESFFATLKKELVYLNHWPTVSSLKLAVVEYIEVFYNRLRRHSSLGFLCPVDFERLWRAQNPLAA